MSPRATAWIEPATMPSEEDIVELRELLGDFLYTVGDTAVIWESAAVDPVVAAVALGRLKAFRVISTIPAVVDLTAVAA